MYGPTLEPVTAVLLADQITVTIEEAIAEQRILPGGYVVCDPFETDRDVLGATLEAMARQTERAELEGYAAMLYHYDAAMLDRCTEGGVITASIPAPLPAETIIDVLEQLSHHPRYRHQLIVGISEDEQFITMRDGTAKIVTEAPA